MESVNVISSDVNLSNDNNVEVEVEKSIPTVSEVFTSDADPITTTDESPPVEMASISTFPESLVTEKLESTSQPSTLPATLSSPSPSTNVAATDQATPTALPPLPSLQPHSQLGLANTHHSVDVLPPPPPLTRTRKRSSLTAAAAAAAVSSTVPSEPETSSISIDQATTISGSTTATTTGDLNASLERNDATTSSSSTAVAPVKSDQPPKKKKKYTPKPKKPAGEPKPKPEPKSKKPPSPPKSKSAPKKTPEKKQNKSSSKTKKVQQQKGEDPSIKTSTTSSVSAGVEENKEIDSISPQQIDLALPAVNQCQTGLSHTAVTIPSEIYIKEEPLDWDENMMVPECDIIADAGECIDEQQQLHDEPPKDKPSTSRKKKSKGRNGNIYIGVFNRIEWMKMQEEFGFQTVNNFGTFVLETMRRVHGDIEFWCNVATASKVYPELSHYEWKNGFPHAVNKEGNGFSPEAVEMTEEKQHELGTMVRTMWEERLELLKQQQQQGEQQDEVPPEVVTVPDEVEEIDEEEVEDIGLEHYLENMASGEYSPMELELGSGQSGSLQQHLTEEQVNQIWIEQSKNPQAMQIFGNLFNLINSIQVLKGPGMHEGQTEIVAEENALKEVEVSDMQGPHELTPENVTVEGNDVQEEEKFLEQTEGTVVVEEAAAC